MGKRRERERERERERAKDRQITSQTDRQRDRPKVIDMQSFFLRLWWRRLQDGLAALQLKPAMSKGVYGAYLLVPVLVLLNAYIDCIITHVEFSNDDLCLMKKKKNKMKSHFFAETRAIERLTMRPHVDGMIAH